MYTGGADERKNLHRLIQAYALLPKSIKESHQLVLVGKMPQTSIDDLMLVAMKSGLARDEVVITGYVEDADLVKLYNSCSLFVFPSLHEGFGIPPLEAMLCGAPVIAANAASLPEVVGREDALFDPQSVTSIRDKLQRALTDTAFRASLIAHGQVHARTFSWDDSARRAIAAMRSFVQPRLATRRFTNPKTCSLALSMPSPQRFHPAYPMRKWSTSRRCWAAITLTIAPRQLLVDVSELAQRDSKSGVQRVTRSILKELLENPPEGYVVEPVYGTLDGPGYRYARHFTARFRGVTSDLDDEQIDYHPGDIFLGLDLQHHVVIAQKDYLASLRRDGVRVYFVVHDLLPITMPHCFLPGVAECHKEWLLVLAGFDGVVCVSQTVSNELKEWLAQNGPRRLREFRIAWSHNGADVENSRPHPRFTRRSRSCVPKNSQVARHS